MALTTKIKGAASGQSQIAGNSISSADVDATIMTASEFTTTATGNIDDLNFGTAATIRMNNASLATIRGLAAGSPGQRVVVLSVGAGQVNLSHQNTGDATAASRLVNFTTSGPTTLAAGVGAAIYAYDATAARWRLISHNQGTWIAVPYAAGNFTASTGAWTVIAGNQVTYAFFLVGTTLLLAWDIQSTNVTANSVLRLAVPGYSINTTTWGFQRSGDATNPTTTGLIRAVTGNLFIELFATAAGAAWTITASNNTSCQGSLSFPVT